MQRHQEPLLARADGDDSLDDDERDIDEEDALLTGQRRRSSDKMSVIFANNRDKILFTWAFISTIVIIVLAVLYQRSQAHIASDQRHGQGRPAGKRNLIFMVSDGMGPSVLSLTRTYNQFVNNLPHDHMLTLDEHLVGQSRTRSSDSYITDSAAGATAFSCGAKSYNGAIGVLHNETTDSYTSCGTVLEAAKRVGYKTGLVVTERMTDATPASFASHVRQRHMEDSIAEQLIGKSPLGRSVDLALGGGRCFFVPNTTHDSRRQDDTNVLALAQQDGWQIMLDKPNTDTDEQSSIRLPLLGLFARKSIPFEIDRRHVSDQFPSLLELTRLALNTLKDATKDSEQGFFLMIEGSKIDVAAHYNDPAAQVHETLAYDRAMKEVLDFIEQEDTTTLMVATSDHETGGLAVGRQLDPRVYPEPYRWMPAALANASQSCSYTAKRYRNYLEDHDIVAIDVSTRESVISFLTTILLEDLGINDPHPAEIQALLHEPRFAAWNMGEMISRRAEVAWSTHGHTAADVNIYASDPIMAQRLVGNHENVEIGKFMQWWLDVEEEVQDATYVLKSLELQEPNDRRASSLDEPTKHMLELGT